MKKEKKEQKRRGFLRFAERLKEVKIDVFRRVDKRISFGPGIYCEGVQSYFQDTFQKHLIINCTIDFNDFAKEIQSKITTLPLIIHHKYEIWEILVRHIKKPNNLVTDVYLELITCLARDLLTEFYPFFVDAFNLIVSLFNLSDSKRLEQCFSTIGYLFKFLRKYIVKDIESLFFNEYFILLSHKKDFIRQFASESFAFLFRNLNREKISEFIQKIFLFLEKLEKIKKSPEIFEENQENQENSNIRLDVNEFLQWNEAGMQSSDDKMKYIVGKYKGLDTMLFCDGLVHLFHESIIGVEYQFHSKANLFLNSILLNLNSKSTWNFPIIFALFQKLGKHTNFEHSPEIFLVIFEYIDKSLTEIQKLNENQENQNKKSAKSKKRKLEGINNEENEYSAEKEEYRRLNELLEILNELISFKNGILWNKNEILKEKILNSILSSKLIENQIFNRSKLFLIILSIISSYLHAFPSGFDEKNKKEIEKMANKIFSFDAIHFNENIIPFSCWIRDLLNVPDFGKLFLKNVFFFINKNILFHFLEMNKLIFDIFHSPDWDRTNLPLLITDRYYYHQKRFILQHTENENNQEKKDRKKLINYLVRLLDDYCSGKIHFPSNQQEKDEEDDEENEKEEEKDEKAEEMQRMYHLLYCFDFIDIVHFEEGESKKIRIKLDEMVEYLKKQAVSPKERSKTLNFLIGKCFTSKIKFLAEYFTMDTREIWKKDCYLLIKSNPNDYNILKSINYFLQTFQVLSRFYPAVTMKLYRKIKTHQEFMKFTELLQSNLSNINERIRIETIKFYLFFPLTKEEEEQREKERYKQIMGNNGPKKKQRKGKEADDDEEMGEDDESTDEGTEEERDGGKNKKPEKKKKKNILKIIFENLQVIQETERIHLQSGNAVHLLNSLEGLVRNPLPEPFVHSIIHSLIGIFFVKFSPLWSVVSKLLHSISVNHAQHVFSILFNLLEEIHLLLFFTDLVSLRNHEKTIFSTNRHHIKGRKLFKSAGNEKEIQFYDSIKSGLQLFIENYLENLSGNTELTFAKEMKRANNQLVEHSDFLDPVNDLFTIHSLLWKTFTLFPNLIESKSKEIVPLFLSFIQFQYSIQFWRGKVDFQHLFNQFNYSPSKKYNSTTEELIIELNEIFNATHSSQYERKLIQQTSDANMEEENTQNRGKKVNIENKIKLLSMKQQESILIDYLKVFLLFKNSKSNKYSRELKEIFEILLSVSTSDVQKHAMKCLFTWRFDYMNEYKENLERLIDEKTLREEITSFNLTIEASPIKPEHRKPLSNIIISVLFGKLISIRKKSTIHRHTLLSYLSSLEMDELEPLFQLLLQPFQNFISLYKLNQSNHYQSDKSRDSSVSSTELYAQLGEKDEETGEEDEEDPEGDYLKKDENQHKKAIVRRIQKDDKDENERIRKEKENELIKRMMNKITIGKKSSTLILLSEFIKQFGKRMEDHVENIIILLFSFIKWAFFYLSNKQAENKLKKKGISSTSVSNIRTASMKRLSKIIELYPGVDYRKYVDFQFYQLLYPLIDQVRFSLSSSTLPIVQFILSVSHSPLFFIHLHQYSVLLFKLIRSIQPNIHNQLLTLILQIILNVIHTQSIIESFSSSPSSSIIMEGMDIDLPSSDLSSQLFLGKSFFSLFPLLFPLF